MKQLILYSNLLPPNLIIRRRYHYYFMLSLCLLSQQLISQVNGEIEGDFRVSSGLPTIELYDNAAAELRIEGALRENNDNIFLDAKIGDLVLTTNDLNRLIIKENGNVGLNISDPSDEFELANIGSPAFRMGMDGLNFRWYQNSNTNASIAAGLGGWIFSNSQTPTSTNLETFLLKTRNNAGVLGDRIAVEGTGSVGIGHNAANPRAIVQLNHKLAGTDVTSNAIKFQNKEGNNARWWAFYVQNGTGDLQIHSSLQGSTIIGTFDANDGSYSSLSDASLKSEIKQMNDVLPRIKLLKPVNYFYTNSTERDMKKIGFLAQDIKPIFPELVHYNKNANLYGINYSGFSTVAIKAIQEQQKQIESLESQLEELKEMLQIKFAKCK